MNKLIFTMLTGFLVSGHVYAEDRALLMGLGNYENSQYNLIGIDHDIKTMQETAALMGFKSVKVLQNEEVTKENVEKTMKSWLVDGIKPQDRVLIYFSGHGSTIFDTHGDEADGTDEVLTTYNVKVVNKNHKNTLEGVIIDDDFGHLLSSIPSHNILVMLDSCHSGTATRSLSHNTMMSKALRYEGMPKPKKTRSLVQKPNVPSSNIVTIGAANDDEESLSVENGGLFTSGFNKVLKEAIAAKKSLTPLEMKQKVDEYIQKRVNTAEYKTFHPQVNGDEKLMNTPFFLAGVNDAAKMAALHVDDLVPSDRTAKKETLSIWTALVNLVKQAEPLEVIANQTTFMEGENLTLKIHAKHAGYLYLISMESRNDVATLLFPNQNHSDNAISVGDFTFPTLQSGFNLTTQAPFGKSLVVALISQEKLDLQTVDKNASIAFLKTLSSEEIKALFRVANDAGKVEILSCQNAAHCQ